MTASIYIPIEVAELLHATLGPLGDVLEASDHPWAPMVRRVLAEYTATRNRFLSMMHGSQIIPEIYHHTFMASERVCSLSDSAIREESDFIRWAAEVDGA